MAVSPVKWATPGAWTAMFAANDLNSLANGSTLISTATAPQINNSTTLENMFQVEFVGGSISPAAGANILVMLIPLSSNGTDYVDGESTATAVNQPAWANLPTAVIQLRAKGTSTQRQQSKPVPLPPGQYKVCVLNRAGVALAASGNQVNIRLMHMGVGA
jgi:hypothetical protein